MVVVVGGGGGGLKRGSDGVEVGRRGKDDILYRWGGGGGGEGRG